MKKLITIQITPTTEDLLKKISKNEESYEQIILEYLPVQAHFGTTDSYAESYPLYTPDEIINFIKLKRKESEYNYNLYSGGKADSTMALIKCYRPGYDYKSCIKLKFISEAQCRAFEKRIKNIFADDNFHPRKY